MDPTPVSAERTAAGLLERRSARELLVCGEPASLHHLAAHQEQSLATYRTRTTSLLQQLAPRLRHRHVTSAVASNGTPLLVTMERTKLHGEGQSTRGSPTLLRCRHHLIAVAHPRRPCACIWASSHLLRLTQTMASQGFAAVECSMRLRVHEVFSLYREDDSNLFDAWRVQKSSPASRETTLKAHTCPGREPKPDHALPAPRHFLQSALRRGRDSRRLSDKLQIPSWNPGLAKGSDPRSLASHLDGPYTCTPIQVPFAHKYSSWALEGMVVTGQISQAS